MFSINLAVGYSESVTYAIPLLFRFYFSLIALKRYTIFD